MRLLVHLVLVVVLVGLAIHAARTEPRRWRVGMLLLGALWAAVSAGSASPWGALVLPCAAAVLLGLLFVATGLRVVRPEGRGLLNLLALVLGAAMVVATVSAVLLSRPDTPTPATTTTVVLLLPGFPGLAFVGYLLYCLAYRRHRPRPAPSAIVVLGSGLVHGTVPRLLARRLDAATDAWREERDLGYDALLVPSGGQGDDEPVAEGLAMTAYLVAHGIPPEAVATEDRATTTEENLLLSREILRSRGLADGHLRVVTSSYHVGRAALLSRHLGIDADVTGGPAPWYVLPSAFLREFLGVVTLHPRTNLAGLAAWAAATAYLASAVPPG